MSGPYTSSPAPTAAAPSIPGNWPRVPARDGQLLWPMLDLIEHAEAAVDDLIDVMGRAAIEAVLLMSAAQAAGPKQQGKKTDRPVASSLTAVRPAAPP